MIQRDSLLGWAFRIVAGLIAGFGTWFLLPWLLNAIFHLQWPDVIIGLFALAAFLLTLIYFRWSRVGPA